MKLAGLAIAGLLSGCAAIAAEYRKVDEPPQPTRPETVQHEDDLRARAAFEMSCDGAGLTITLLSSSMLHDVAGVQGCGQKRVYVSDRGAWLLDSTTTAR